MINCQQCQQYQQDKQRPLTSNHWTQKRLWYLSGYSGPGLGQSNICGSVKLAIGVPTLLLIIGSPTAIQI